jgi:hypothetical protein
MKPSPKRKVPHASTAPEQSKPVMDEASAEKTPLELRFEEIGLFSESKAWQVPKIILREKSTEKLFVAHSWEAHWIPLETNC